MIAKRNLIGEVKAVFRCSEQRYEQIRELGKDLFYFILEEMMSEAKLEVEIHTAIRFNIVREKL